MKELIEVTTMIADTQFNGVGRQCNNFFRKKIDEKSEKGEKR